MADGEVEVSVRAEGVEDAAGEMTPDAAGAEGVEDAAGEMAPDAAGPDIGGPGGDGRGGRGRLLGKTLTKLVALFAFIEPILDVLGVISQVVKALVAPLAVLLLRLLQPALRLLIRVLPYVLDLTDILIDLLEQGRELEASLFNAIFDAARQLGGWILSLPERIWEFMQRLPSMIGMAVGNVLPDVPTLGGGDGFLSELRDAVGGGAGDFFGGPGEGVETGGPVVNITGGLEAFIRRITQDSDFDFP
jgi:hypothetical protein